MAVASPLTGAVLTGGVSRRMGMDKAFVEVGGRPLVVVAADALAGAGADPVFAVGGDAPRLAALGLRVLPDRHAGQGPLGGIITALAAAPGELVAVVACDVPAADPRAIRTVAGALAGDARAGVAVAVAGGRRQPLLAVWRRDVLPALEWAWDAGERAAHHVLDHVEVVEVVVPGHAVADVDTPDEVAALGAGDLTGQTGIMSDQAIPEIDVDELAERAKEGAWILDVRQPDEYAEGHVPGAVLIPLDQLGERHHEVPRDREIPVICKTGGRSAAAVDALNTAGYRAVNVVGGTMAWIEAGNPVDTGPAG